ncbi:DUF309 domain-containing protein [Bacillus piscicola]|uniref:DUF309 domain-containing protein n=1 Tax=Bacillus piscicola TaxID=1632684 RepID=UPI001F08F1C6|nr:DUF309 domain-containing protein [Bacillus piscicola]
MYPQAYIRFLVQFHAYRDFFECHEILEEYWKKEDKARREDKWVGLIQFAVALYHHRRENWRGAEKLIISACQRIREHRSELRDLSIDTDELLKRIDRRLAAIRKKERYTDVNLPLTDSSLESKCQDECAKENVTWLSDSDLSDPYIIHRHILRDRTVCTKLLSQKNKLLFGPF